jgi:hypothetical protein
VLFVRYLCPRSVFGEVPDHCLWSLMCGSALQIPRRAAWRSSRRSSPLRETVYRSPRAFPAPVPRLQLPLTAPRTLIPTLTLPPQHKTTTPPRLPLLRGPQKIRSLHSLLWSRRRRPSLRADTPSDPS